MSMIELECPHCGSDLEVDRGFAGGICRCSSCGTLMTVPVNPRVEAVEELHRPDAPRVAREFPDDRYDDDEDPLDALSRTTTSVEVFTTDSGKIFEVTKSRIPVAQKRKIARGATYAVFGLVALLIIVAAVVIGAFMIRGILNRGNPSGEGDPGPPPVVIDETFEYRPERSPYDLDQPNMLGLPVEGKAVVLLDTSKPGDHWLTQARKMLDVGQNRRDDEAFAIKEINRPSGWIGAVGQAVTDGHAQIVIIAGPEGLADDQAASIAGKMRTERKIRFDVFIIDNENQTLFDAATKSGGESGQIRSGRLDTWTRNHQTR